MTDDRILAVKLHMPKLRHDIVPRKRLSERLDEGLHRRLTLVSAPAGFGKTTLISEWLEGIERETAWFSIDQEDNDITRFLTYLILSLGSISESIGSRLLPLVQSTQPLPVDTLMTYVVDEISELPKPYILVLDDLHCIQAKPVYDAVHFLLDYMPPQMHMVISTRDTASLRLSRLRVRDQMTELRAEDLRFTAPEAERFMNRTMGLALNREEVHLLEARTEGWIAGLQLAALSMKGSADPLAIIQSFGGSHHLVLDYLLEEVLRRSPSHIQNFLLRTAVLDRMCGPLCDALLDVEAQGGESMSGQDILEYLERANLFVIPLDNERFWYRYHHLFLELLRHRLQRSTRMDQPVLHIQASRWYEAKGLFLEAFHHAAEAGDIDRAARLLAGNGMPLHLRGAAAPILDWLRSLDPSVLHARPDLWVMYASALTVSGHPIHEVEDKLTMAEAALRHKEASEETNDLAGHISAIRAMLGIPLLDAEAIKLHSKNALERLRPDNLPIRTSATWTLGFAHQLQGEYDAARRAYIRAIASSRATGNLLVTFAATICLGQVQEAELQLHAAAESYREVLQLAGDPPLPSTCEAYHGMARLLYEWNRLAEAEEYGQLAARLATQLQTVDTPAACYVLLARIKLGQGDARAAAAYIDQAEQFLLSRHAHGPMSELKEVQVWLALRRGELAAADKLTEKLDGQIARSRVRWAQGKTQEAVNMLQLHLVNIRQQHQKQECLRTMIVLSLLLRAAGDKDASARMLEEALELAEPGGYIRIFADEGEPMRQLLAEAHVRGWVPAYTRRLLGAFAHDTTATSASMLLEPLTTRELQVLRLIAQGLSNEEIGKRLFLALDTVKGHNRRIYGKLQVQRRTEAVARARELGLI